jgi:predicted RND superfamily exporter protein
MSLDEKPGLLRKAIDRLSDLQIRRPLLPIAFVAVVTVFFGYFASKLELRTRYEALLPESQPSVIELNRVQKRVAAAQMVLILLEGDDRAANRAMGDALIPALLALGPDTISSAEDGIHEARKFLEPRAGLFLDREDLEKLKADVDARWDYEVTKESGFLLDDSEPPPPLDGATMKKRFEDKLHKRASGRSVDSYPDGYYESKDGKALVVAARSPIAGGDLAKIGPALDRIHAAVDKVKASNPAFANIRVGYAGDMPTGYIEYGVAKNDLLSVGAEGIALVLLVVALYFMRARAIFVMAVTILTGLLWTFGLTALVIGHLNIATGFLVSIVAGNGINVGILYQSRYFEERRKGVAAPDALRTSVLATWQPTVIAAVAAAASYGSLLITDFRAFRQFGFIAASGMLLCWVVKTLMVPPLLILLDGKRVVDPKKEQERGWLGRLRASGVAYGRVMAALVPLAPRTWLGLGLVTAVVGTYASVQFIRNDPMDYDLANVQNDRSQTVELHRVWDVVNEVLGGGHGAMIVLTDTPEEAKELSDKLLARWDAAPEDQKPFVAVHSLWNFVPADQEAKLPTLLALAERLERAHERGFVSEKDWKDLAPMMPPPDLKPFGLADLPASLASTFSENDGTRGTVVLIEPEANSGDDLHYLLRYSDSFRETKLDSGKVVRGSGRAIVFSDILRAVVLDIPKAVALSLAMTLVAVFLTFRRGAYSASVLLALLMGTGGIGAFLYFSGVKLNFLNFAALPITFGIGVDYAINVIQRYRDDGGKDILSALRTTGGAVVLCSLTTTLGYVALIGSHNRAIRSMGVIAVVGEVSCLLTAMLALPALWLLVERRASSKDGPAQPRAEA